MNSTHIIQHPDDVYLRSDVQCEIGSKGLDSGDLSSESLEHLVVCHVITLIHKYLTP